MEKRVTLQAMCCIAVYATFLHPPWSDLAFLERLQSLSFRVSWALTQRHQNKITNLLKTQTPPKYTTRTNLIIMEVLTELQLASDLTYRSCVQRCSCFEAFDYSCTVA
jgi:hypothetical protein